MFGNHTDLLFRVREDVAYPLVAGRNVLLG